MGIKGMDDQLQQLVDFSLKFSLRHRPSLSTKTGIEAKSAVARLI
jgi:hypothetical protein